MARGVVVVWNVVERRSGKYFAGTAFHRVPAPNILEPERRSGKYRWPQVER